MAQPQRVQDLLDYVYEHYTEFMTMDERAANRYALLILPRIEDAGTEHERKKWLTMGSVPLTPKAKELMADGFEAFKNHVVNRILAEHGANIHINRCPKCDGLCRTPLAQQCRFCYHSWHAPK